MIVLTDKVDKRSKRVSVCYSGLCKCQITRDGQDAPDESRCHAAKLAITMIEHD